jgi:hypothetical protein
MPVDPFEARRKSFEEEYFRRKDAQLVDHLKSVFHRRIEREEIRNATGITDERVLDTLVALDLSGEMMAAFNLYPLVDLAWADGKPDERECRAILAAIKESGIAEGSAAYRMLDTALKNGPNPDARKAWYAYAAELKRTLSPAELATFRRDLLEHARAVAAASGGLLNIAFTVSASERRVLDTIEQALA